MSSPYPKLKIYIEAPFERRPEALELKAVLEAHDAIVISTWLTPDDCQSMTVLEKDRNKHDECRKRALVDVEEIKAADYVILLKPKAWHKQPTTGGHHVETGIAIAVGTPIILMGDRENVFHYHPLVQVAGSSAEVVRLLHL